MNEHTLASSLTLACAMGLVGLIGGLVYFRALRRTVDLLTGRRGWFAPAALTLARLAAAIAMLTLMARLGAAPLFAGFMGFLLARAIALHAARRAG